MKRYSPKEIEPKWQKIWQETNVYTADLESDKPKYIAMSMFNYPSGSGIHVGHAMNYTISDVKSRFKRQQGYESYHPVGWDSFGLPAENYAIKAGVSPQESMATIIPGYRKQYQAMGWSNDWEKEIATHTPEYYKWTQWIFSQMHKNGLAYQDSRMQWWCTKCQTVLANEQVTADNKCWRHEGKDDPVIEKKEIKQWFFKITEFADELLDATDALNWTDHVKTSQKNWIGRSEGAEIKFPIKKVVNPNPEMARSYIMGQKNITQEDVTLLGGRVDSVTDSGHLCIEFPISKCEHFEKLIVDKMEQGFWNEYLTNDEIIFLFKEKNGEIKRFVLGDDNAHEICVIGNRFNEQPKPLQSETAWSWLANNEWYAQIIPHITVFTTRADTLFGATFMVLAPEHELALSIATPENRDAVEGYIRSSANKSEVERQASKEKSGVFTGSYVINPINGEQMPIWVADYVLGGYGTGAVMAVPAHDERDHEFATKFDLSIKQVVAPYFPPDPGEEWVEGYEETTRNNVAVMLKHWSEDKYLCLKWKVEGKNWQSLVMGGVEDGETPEQAAKREVAEETGYTDINIDWTDPINYISKYCAEHKKLNRTTNTCQVFATLNSDQMHSDKLDDENHDALWVEADKVLEFVNLSNHKYTVESGLGLKHDVKFGEVLINSAQYDGLSSQEAKSAIVADLVAKGFARTKINYKMRDWSVSRQRYWGAPIPIVNCADCGPVLVPDDQLPVVLPELTDFAPSGDGRSALARATDWLQVTCPQCGGDAERETDTLDTYICSSWYMLRYLDPHNQEAIFDPGVVNKWMPVDFYNGGDHATAHLLYARFVTRFLHKQGLVSDPEPFKQMLFNGKVTASDGSAFSKTLGNGPDPLEIIASGYGADALRTYIMFAAPLEFGAKWDAQGVPGAYRFLNRLWNIVQEYLESPGGESDKSQVQKLSYTTNKMVKKVTEDLEYNRYNTAISACMENVNELYKIKANGLAHDQAWQLALESAVACVAPFAPHMADELWQQLGHSASVHKDSWPEVDESQLTLETMTIVVQVNGKFRAQIQVSVDAIQQDIVLVAKSNERVVQFIGEAEIKREIYIPGKVVNLVI